MYGNDNIIDLLIETIDKIRTLLKWDNTEPSEILITKTMLGIFGNIPAFDRLFKKGLGVCTCCKSAFTRIYNFYCFHKSVIDSKKIYTLDFINGQTTDRCYTKAKLIDMIGFVEGS